MHERRRLARKTPGSRASGSSPSSAHPRTPVASPRERHQPQDSVLYRVVRDHLDEFLRTAREQHGGLPSFIEKTFRAYLKCGLPEFGFVHVKCESCGHDDIVAFSCKKRGLCPSCSARGMGDGAAHLVDHVLPNVPYRQWVVGYPFEYLRKLAFQPSLLAAVERIAADAVKTWMMARCGGGEAGGVLVRHRFGGSLNLHLHAHLLVMDGVYRRDADGGMVFEAAAPPQRAELEELAGNIHGRIITLMQRRGLLAAGDGVNNEPPEVDTLAACANVALSTGVRERSGPALALVDDADVESSAGGVVAAVDGLNLYASPVMDGNNRKVLEKVCRYLLRGPLSLARLKERPDGMLTYRMKKPDRRGNTLLVMTPLELLMRLSSLIPAPRHPTRKFFGILASGAKDRRRVVPKPTQRREKHAHPETGTPGPPVASPVKWADLLRRVWGLDALDCPRCHGRMTPIAVIENPEEVARYLAHTGQLTVHRRARAPPLADAA